MRLFFVLISSFLLCAHCTHSQTSAAPANASASVDDANAAPEVGSEGDDDVPIEAAAAQSDFANLPKPDALVAEANRELAAMRSSSYTHKTHVDEASGTFDFDCSGFLGYALAHADPTAWKSLKAATVKRPLAKHFTDFFESLPNANAQGWTRVAKVEELRPGDVIAWKKPADVVTKNTGHVLLVRAAPTKQDDEWRVPIFDSTHVRHGKDDSRTATDSDGLGTGTIVLRVDSTGAPTAYRWAPVAKDKAHETTIALGRLTP
jgi:hypothetical protein